MRSKQGLRSKRSPFALPVILLFALGLVWGSSWIASARLAEALPPLRASALRFLLAGLICFLFGFGKQAGFPRGRALAASLILSLTLVTLPVALLVWAQPRLSSATVVVSFAAMPLMLSLAASWAAARASMVALGTLAVSLGFSFYLDQTAPAAGVLVAVALVAASSRAVRVELRRESPAAVAALLLGPAGFLLGIASLLFEHGASMHWTWQLTPSLIFLGVVAGAGGYVTYIWLLQRLDAYKVAALEWIGPLVSVFESAWFLRIAPSWQVMAGALITLVCLWLVLRARPEDDDPVSLLGDGPLKVG